MRAAASISVPFLHEPSRIGTSMRRVLPPQDLLAAAGITVEDTPAFQRLMSLYFPDGLRNAAGKLKRPAGQHCSDRHAQGSITCSNPLCIHGARLFEVRLQREDQLDDDTDKSDKRERELVWQQVHSQQRVHKKMLQGYMFFFCTCGMPYTFPSCICI